MRGDGLSQTCLRQSNEEELRNSDDLLVSKLVGDARGSALIRDGRVKADVVADGIEEGCNDCCTIDSDEG